MTMILIGLIAACKPTAAYRPPQPEERPPQAETDSPLQPIVGIEKEPRKAVEETYSLDSFVYPLTSGYFNSPWCKCRSIGSSPHIGQDLNSDPNPEISVALSDGHIKSLTFDSACGHAVWFVDKFGAEWRYLHLDKPVVKEGQKVKAGQELGRHGSYPTYACGTGPHLHLERRSRGRHPGEETETRKACDSRGLRSCFYDPTIISSSRVLKNPLPSQSLSKSLSLSEHSLDAANESAQPTLAEPCGALVKPLAVKDPRTVDPTSPMRSHENLHITAIFEKTPQLQWQIEELSFRQKSNPSQESQNYCIPSQGNTNCVDEVRIYSRNSLGEWFLNHERLGLRNTSLQITASHSLCLPAESDKVLIVTRSPAGEERMTALAVTNDAPPSQ